MKYSAMWASFRMTPCQRLISPGERAGKMNVNTGTMNREVSPDDMKSVEKKNIAASHTSSGVQYSTTSLFTEY